MQFSWQFWTDQKIAHRAAQKLALIRVAGAYRTTSTAALRVLIKMPSKDLVINERAKLLKRMAKNENTDARKCCE